MLGKLQPDFFPLSLVSEQTEKLDADVVRQKFASLAAEVSVLLPLQHVGIILADVVFTAAPKFLIASDILNENGAWRFPLTSAMRLGETGGKAGKFWRTITGVQSVRSVKDRGRRSVGVCQHNIVYLAKCYMATTPCAIRLNLTFMASSKPVPSVGTRSHRLLRLYGSASAMNLYTAN